MWATVGSSNLDPLSLSLNLEANVVIRDRDFAAALRDNLDGLMREHCKALEHAALAHRRTGWRVLVDTLAFHLTRHFPAWAGWLPAHTPVIEPVKPAHQVAPPPTERARDGVVDAGTAR